MFSVIALAAISIMLSLLARLHNILDDNSNRELNIDYMHLWPTSISKYCLRFEIDNRILIPLFWIPFIFSSVQTATAWIL